MVRFDASLLSVQSLSLRRIAAPQLQALRRIDDRTSSPSPTCFENENQQCHLKSQRLAGNLPVVETGRHPEHGLILVTARTGATVWKATKCGIGSGRVLFKAATSFSTAADRQRKGGT
jgi:hypothetical protein